MPILAGRLGKAQRPCAAAALRLVLGRIQLCLHRQEFVSSSGRRLPTVCITPTPRTSPAPVLAPAIGQVSDVRRAYSPSKSRWSTANWAGSRRSRPAPRLRGCRRVGSAHLSTCSSELFQWYVDGLRTRLRSDHRARARKPGSSSPSERRSRTLSAARVRRYDRVVQAALVCHLTPTRSARDSGRHARRASATGST